MERSQRQYTESRDNNECHHNSKHQTILGGLRMGCLARAFVQLMLSGLLDPGRPGVPGVKGPSKRHHRRHEL